MTAGDAGGGHRETARDGLGATAAAHPGATAWLDLATGTGLTLGAWDADADRLAGGLADHGVAPGDRVAIVIGPDRPFAWLITYVAVHRAGAVAVPLNTRLAAPELRAILLHAEPSALVADATTESGVPWTDLTGRLPGFGLLVTTEAAPGALEWSEVLRPAGSARPERPAGPATDLMYTSGTTGAPKGVVAPHPSDPAPQFPAEWNGLGFLTSSPFSTTSGVLLVDGPRRAGMAGWYQPRFDPGEWLSIVERRRPTVAFVVPAMAQLLVAHPRFGEADLSGLAALTIGGAPVAPATLERLAAGMPGTEILVGYGLTEFGAVARSPAGDRGRHLGSVGRPLPGVEVRIVDGHGRPAGPGVEGEITVSGVGPRRRYFREEDATTETWPDGWLRTGDLGRLDEDGFLWITGRTKDLIIRGGHNIAPGEVENALYAHPDVVEAAVAGLPHDVLGEDVAAWVVRRERSTTTEHDLRAFLAGRLADYKVPRRLFLVASLPRNSAGKVATRDLVAGVGPAGPSGS